MSEHRPLPSGLVVKGVSLTQAEHTTKKNHSNPEAVMILPPRSLPKQSS